MGLSIDIDKMDLGLRYTEGLLTYSFAFHAFRLRYWGRLKSYRAGMNLIFDVSNNFGFLDTRAVVQTLEQVSYGKGLITSRTNKT